MSDRIDTDAIRRRKTALSRAQIVALCDEVDALRASKEALIRKLKATQDRLAVVAGALSDHDLRRFYYGKCQEVDALRSREVPDGHVRIDGKVYEATKLVTRGDGTGSFLSVLVPVEEPCYPLPDTPEVSPPPGEPDEGETGHIAAMERVAVDALRSKRDGYRSVIQEIADTSEDAATVRFARRALGFDEGER